VMCVRYQLTGNKNWRRLEQSSVSSQCAVLYRGYRCVCTTEQFNVLWGPLQKWLAKVAPRLSVSEPVYGNRDTVKRLIESHQVSYQAICVVLYNSEYTVNVVHLSLILSCL